MNPNLEAKFQEKGRKFLLAVQFSCIFIIIIACLIKLYVTCYAEAFLAILFNAYIIKVLFYYFRQIISLLRF